MLLFRTFGFKSILKVFLPDTYFTFLFTTEHQHCEFLQCEKGSKEKTNSPPNTLNSHSQFQESRYFNSLHALLTSKMLVFLVLSGGRTLSIQNKDASAGYLHTSNSRLMACYGFSSSYPWKVRISHQFHWRTRCKSAYVFLNATITAMKVVNLRLTVK